MQKDNKWFYIMVMVVFSVLFISMAVSESRKNTTERDLKYLNCVEAMQKAIPDPNDNGRASFLQSCEDNWNEKN